MLQPPHAKVMSLLNLMVHGLPTYKRQKGYKCATKELLLYSYKLSGFFVGCGISNKLSFVVAIQAYYCYITKWLDYSFDARYIHSLNAPKSLF